ncbi:VCBS repeat-containing protein [Streptomyces graminilatus]|uniref:VCBS repeat-containing protein n=1 Tax=Streptomyces graminilatus TaxID=1464070 RepID=UPI0006E1A534|nr:VCBS repeat-containing protein [Streptomyces graminilatus]
MRLYLKNETTGTFYERGASATGKSTTSYDFAASGLRDGRYRWNVYLVDRFPAPSATSYNCYFNLDTTAPKTPDIASEDFTEADNDNDSGGSDWSRAVFGQSGCITFANPAADKVTKYVYSWNVGTFDKTVSLSSPGTCTTKTGKVVRGTSTTAVISTVPPLAGPAMLYVRAFDAAGNQSPTSGTYRVFVSPKDRDATPGDLTGDDQPDLLTIGKKTEENGATHYDLRDFPSGVKGDLFLGMNSSYGRATKNTAYADGCTSTVSWKGALITHLGDYYPGDGLQDLIARMGDGSFYIYPGDGFGGFNTCARQRILLPATGKGPNGTVGVPDPAAFDQILSADDVTGDDRPDLFVTAGTQLWVFTGYTGASFSSALLLNDGPAWTDRDLVNVSDITGDGIADMLYRLRTSGGLALRQGKANSAGTGVDLLSLATSGASATGTDADYATGGWSATDIPLLFGTPDVTGNGIPDIWAHMSNGTVRLYAGGRSAVGPYTQVIDQWTGMQALG